MMELVRLGDVIIQSNQRHALTKLIKEYRLCKLITRKEELAKRLKKETHFSTKAYYISLKDLHNVYHYLSVSNAKGLLNDAHQCIGIFLGEIDIRECNYE